MAEVTSPELTVPVHVSVQPVDLPAEGGPWPVQGEWTYEDYLRLPENGKRYEIIDGVLYMTPAPRFDHQYVVQFIVRRVGDYAEQQGLGVVLPAPFEVRLSETTQPVQPDVVFMRVEHRPTVDAAAFEGAPDLVVEVLSPSSIRTDRVVKFQAYEQVGVPEYWIIDPQVRLVEVYVLRGGIYVLHGKYLDEQTLSSPTFPELALSVQDLFPR